MRADAQRNLDKIVQAAVEVVAERGVNPPMKAIAERAGVGVGTLYRRFPDHSALLSAVARHHVESISEAIADATESSDDAWAAIRTIVDWVTSPGRGALAAALSELPDGMLDDSEELTGEEHQWVAQLSSLVRQAQSDGDMRTDVNADDIMNLLNVFTCHPNALPAPVSADPTRYLHIMLDGMQDASATPIRRKRATG
ncbi:MAG TPA: TetR/AcrR family transcriptional regulator [Microlunatus sp.]